MLRKILTVSAIMFLMLSSRKNDTFANAEEHAREDEWNPVSAGPVTTWTAPLCGKGQFVIQPFFFYNRTRGIFNSQGHYDSLPKGDSKYQLQQQFFAQYGITDRLEIDGQTVYQDNHVKQGDLKAHSNGTSDTYLFLRYCAFEENQWRPHLTGLLQIKAPTGKYQHADVEKFGTDLMGATSGGGSWDHGFGILLTKKMRPVLIHMDAIYSFPQKVRLDGVRTMYDKYLSYDFGIEYFLPNGFNLMLEFNGFLQGDRKDDGTTIPASGVKYLTVVPGIGWSNSKIQTLLAYQRTVSGSNTDANDSVVFTFVHTF